jgi:nitroreductase
MLQPPLVLALAAREARSGYYDGKAQTPFGDWMLFDCPLAAQNACLTAHARSLGTVILGQFDHADLEKALGVPDDYSIVCLIPLGHPAKKPNTPPRREVDDFVHRNTF